jgi:hypothetical protein
MEDVPATFDHWRLFNHNSWGSQTWWNDGLDSPHENYSYRYHKPLLEAPHCRWITSPQPNDLATGPQLWAIVPWPRDDHHFGLSYLGHHGRTVLATLHQLREGTQHHLAARARRAAKGGRNGQRNGAKWPVKWVKTCENPDAIAISSCKSTGTKWIITGYREW